MKPNNYYHYPVTFLLLECQTFRGWQGMRKVRVGAVALGKSRLEERCGGDFVEGEVLGGAAGAVLPCEEEAAVAIGEAGGGIDFKFGEGIVDPRGWAFEFSVVANGGLVDDEVTRGGQRGFYGMSRISKERAVYGRNCLRPLGTKFLVAEDGRVSHRFEDGA